MGPVCGIEQMKRIFLAAFLLVVGFAAVAQAQEQTQGQAQEQAQAAAPVAEDPAVIDVGGVKINLPPPGDFREVTGVSAVMSDLAGKFVPADNLLFGMYLPQEGYDTILAGRIPRIGRYAFLQTPRSTLLETFDAAGTARIIAAASQAQQVSAADASSRKIQGELDRSSGDFNRDYGVDMRSRVEGTQPLGVFWEDKQAIGFSQLVRYNFDVDGQVSAQEIVTSAVIMVINGKVLFAYVYSPHTGEEDVLWGQEQARHWAQAILAANDPAVIAARQQALAAAQQAVLNEDEPETDGRLPFSLAQLLAGAGAVLAIAALAMLRLRGRA